MKVLEQVDNKQIPKGKKANFEFLSLMGRANFKSSINTIELKIEQNEEYWTRLENLKERDTRSKLKIERSSWKCLTDTSNFLQVQETQSKLQRPIKILSQQLKKKNFCLISINLFKLPFKDNKEFSHATLN